MHRQEELLESFHAVRNERHEIAMVSLAVDLSERTLIVGEDWARLLQNALHPFGAKFRDFAYETSVRYGVPIARRQLVLTPVPRILGQADQSVFVEFARQVDRVAGELQFDCVQGFSTVFAAGVTPGNATFLKALPQALTATRSIQAIVEPARSRNGISLDSLELIAETIQETAKLSAGERGAAAGRLAVGANLPSTGVYFLGNRWRDGGAPVVVDIGIDGLSVIETALRRLSGEGRSVALTEVFEEIKCAAFRVVRVGELIGRDIADACGAAFGTVDLSIGVDHQDERRLSSLLSLFDGEVRQAPGSALKWAMISNALATGGRFASPHYGGFCGVAVPPVGAQRDRSVSDTVSMPATGQTISHADLTAVPDSAHTDVLAAMLGDRMMLGVQNQICQVSRIVPVPDAKPGDVVDLGPGCGEVLVQSVAEPPEEIRRFTMSGWLSGLPRSL